MFFRATAQAPSWPCPPTTAATTAFARHFDLPVIPLIEGADVSKESFDAKEGTMINSEAPH